MTDVEETVEIQPISFPPEVFARISPELSLQRHLALGLRPSLRRFDEFRDIEINEDSLSRFNASHMMNEDSQNNILGSNVLKCGKTFVITSITGGIIEDTSTSLDEVDIGEKELLDIVEQEDSLNKYTSVYPVVEVERGRVGACTDEEMTVSQKLFDSLLHSRIIPKDSLKVQTGIRTTDENGVSQIIYPDEVNNVDGNDVDDSYKHVMPRKKWSYVLYAKIVVYSRTGPVFDMCWNSLMYALQSTRLPRAFIDERATDLKMTVRMKGRSTTIREAYDILCDPKKSLPLTLNDSNLAYASSFGIIDLDPEVALEEARKQEDKQEDVEMDKIDSILLADIDTEAEESSIYSTISLINNLKGDFKQLSIIGAGSRITPNMIRNAITLSKCRSQDLSQKIKK
ncbi:exosome non-catalytic core subunit RRP43 NDAI_0A00720 [Naumovozyma dairenensis CBS 421]|uniref:Ribosomal RNA-processing protein 43 n=1 Tax=Naumovozyma dairenensis (strain ATCC 10597 / BCRC 20456 / CBS 421 / NBRC 0211 / NRRL Y-12639) TaxID=1071378 RepID=G0W342_NAUDC|nr:hypothetical protein NDAI_0A00720 [Naumovozyma dairenensis CBS 421]CCD22230.1 hypothetical protein NDAI_0A00720 [Naumovozyma dairenensis CBS 421]